MSPAAGACMCLCTIRTMRAHDCWKVRWTCSRTHNSSFSQLQYMCSFKLSMDTTGKRLKSNTQPIHFKSFICNQYKGTVVMSGATIVICVVHHYPFYTSIIPLLLWKDQQKLKALDIPIIWLFLLTSVGTGENRRRALCSCGKGLVHLNIPSLWASVTICGDWIWMTWFNKRKFVIARGGENRGGRWGSKTILIWKIR